LRENLKYTVTTPSGKKIPPPEKGWRWAETTFNEKVATGEILFVDNETRVIRKIYLEDQEGRVPESIWFGDDVGTTRQATSELSQLLPDAPVFATPKPEKLIEKIVTIATNPGDLVLDSFLGSGTTAAVAHKMGRRWIGIELGEHCHTHCIPRLSKVIDGEDAGGITEAVGWKGGGGFRYYKLAPSLLTQDKWGQWVISKEYNAPMLAEAVCKHENFSYAPSGTLYWQQGRSTERDFIYVTTATLSHEQLQELSEEVGSERTLLVVCSAFRGRKEGWGNLTVKKIPSSVLTRCEWGHDDYSLKVENLPKAPPSAPKTDAKTGQQSLFGEEAGK
jgi:adenine-specific DNA-methyltransferase